jgi:anti-anti-sigma regulatory factor
VTVSSDAQITELAVDDHACLTFGEPDELLDLTAAFVRDGLSGGLKVIWLSDAGPKQAITELARRGIAVEAALAARQITALACENYLLSGQSFAAGHAMSWLNEQMAASRSEGFSGLRVALDMSWALRPIVGVEQLPDFEENIGKVITDTTVSVLCQYDRERFDPVTLASVGALHSKSVAAATYYADAVLRICRQYAPPGIRLAGEIDYHAEEPLSMALAEALRLDGDITVTMTDLSFTDVSCMRMIINLAKSLPAPTKVILQCQPGIASRFAALGVADVSSIRLEVVDDR